ncbi:MAG TPA: hypothetical protein DDZ88_30255 [Verrucomicrobiales bacterium]|nr:hypothetical protein [Verrucomicrobiales bacterium]
MNPDCQLATGRPAASREDGRPTYRNFLIIAPDPDDGTDLPDGQVQALARHLNQNGFAYVARRGQKEMEDDSSGVRYLPLGEDLPSFGLMSVVIVLRDPAWAKRAATAYPGADVFLLEPRPRAFGCG